jgi:hypothetical protein
MAYLYTRHTAIQGRAKPLLLNQTSQHYGNTAKWLNKILGNPPHFSFLLQGGEGEANQARWISKRNLVLFNAILLNANSAEGYVAWTL